MDNRHYQVVVIGTGLAGLSAAIAAREEGASVIILEKAPESSSGGNTRFSGGGFRAPEGSIYSPEDLYEDIMRETRGRANPTLSSLLINRGEEAVAWFRGLGISFDEDFSQGRPDFKKGGRLRYHFTENGYGLIISLIPIAIQHGVEIHYETKALDLLTDDTGTVVGVRAKGPEGIRNYYCQGVVVCSGGFQANTEMRVRYIGPEADKLVVRGTKYNTGDGLRMAMEIGAKGTGQWGDFHSALIDYRSEPVEAGETNINTYPYTILVNKFGRRFVDEGVDFFDTTYVKYGKEILKQTDGLSYCIFDARVYEQDLVYNLRKDFKPVQAGSLELLAELLGIDQEGLITTVEQFNAAVQPGDFNPDYLDGKRTVGLSPEKSNWALPIDTPPYFGYKLTGGITFTFGGLLVNTRAQVLDTEDRSIPGLYAAGEILGEFFYYGYPGGCSLLRAAIFGRIAGQEAAKRKV